MAYMGFKKVEAAVAKGGARNPAAVAAAIGRKKYGKAKFQKAAAAGKSMRGMESMHEAGEHMPPGMRSKMLRGGR